jgi:hypothetical protein
MPRNHVRFCANVLIGNSKINNFNNSLLGRHIIIWFDVVVVSLFMDHSKTKQPMSPFILSLWSFVISLDRSLYRIASRISLQKQNFLFIKMMVVDYNEGFQTWKQVLFRKLYLPVLTCLCLIIVWLPTKRLKLFFG